MSTTATATDGDTDTPVGGGGDAHESSAAVAATSSASSFSSSSSTTTTTTTPSRTPSESESELPFRFATAAILERTPVVLPEPSAAEARFRELRMLMHNATARELPAEFFAERARTGADAESLSPLSQAGVGVDEEDDTSFKAASRVTEADESDDRRSLRRKLDQRLVLLVRRQMGGARSIWQFPQRIVDEDSMSVPFRELAERALRTVIDEESARHHRQTQPQQQQRQRRLQLQQQEEEQFQLHAHFVGNAPCAHLRHDYGRKFRDKHGVRGLKVFFYRAVLVRGQVSALRQSMADDWAWVTAAELPEYLPSEYYAAVRNALW